MKINFDDYKKSKRLQELATENFIVREHMNTLEAKFLNADEDCMYSKKEQDRFNRINKLIELESTNARLWEEVLTKTVLKTKFENDPRYDEIDDRIDSLHENYLSYLDSYAENEDMEWEDYGIKEFSVWFKKYRPFAILLLILTGVIYLFLMNIFYSAELSYKWIFFLHSYFGLWLSWFFCFSLWSGEIDLKNFLPNGLLSPNIIKALDLTPLSWFFLLINPLIMLVCLLFLLVTTREINKIKNNHNQAITIKMREKSFFNEELLFELNSPYEFNKEILSILDSIDEIEKGHELLFDKMVENTITYYDYKALIEKNRKKGVK